jgi:transcriptional regulator with XRE-family HTH domain
VKGLQVPETEPAPSENTFRFGAPELRRLGRHLCDQRKAAGLTLRVLSERSEVGVASIRALEAGSSSPSLTIVLRVIGALGLTIDQVVAEAMTADTRVVVTRKTVPDGAPVQALSKGLEKATLDACRMEIAQDAVCKTPVSLAAAPSFCMVIAGTLTAVTQSSDRIRLNAGDSYHAAPGEVQTWANTGTGSAHLICVADKTPRDDTTRQP